LTEEDTERRGFLSAAAATWADKHASQHASSFSLAESFISLAHRYLSTQNRSSFGISELVPTLVFERSLHHYQAVLVLTKNGMVPASRALTRVLLESQFIFLAVLHDEHTLNLYLDQLQMARRKTMHKLENSVSPILADLRSTASEVDRDELARLIEDGAIRNLSVDEFARKADLTPIYITAYSVLSGAVHSTAHDLEDDVEFGPNNEIVDFRNGQRGDQTVALIANSGALLADSLSQLSKRAAPNIASECEQYHDQFLKLNVH